MQYITPLRFFLLCKVVYSASQQSTEEEEGLTSIQAIVAYGLIAVPLSILCICAAYKRFSGNDRRSSSGPQTPKSAEPQTPTLLASRRAVSFNEKKERDLESGRSTGAISQGHDPQEVDLDDFLLAQCIHSQAFGSKESHAVAGPVDNGNLTSETSETFSVDEEGRVNVTQGSIDG